MTTDLINAGTELIRRGWPIVACNDKVPLGGKDWHKQTLTPESLAHQLLQASAPAIGLRLGPQSAIDIEADSPDEESLVGKLFDGCDIPITPTYQSMRGKHRLFKFDNRFHGINKAVVHFSNGNGAKLGIRVGADDTAAQSVIPPSAGREWLVSLDDCDPAPLPGVVIDRILDAAGKRRHQKSSSQNGCLHSGDRETAISALNGLAASRADSYSDWLEVGMALHSVSPDLLEEWDGWSQRSPKYVAGVCAEKWKSFGGEGVGIGTLIHLAKQDSWKSADRETISNYTTTETQDADGKRETIAVPKSMEAIIGEIKAITNGWPRKIDNMLFVDDEHGIAYFDRRTVAGLFGFLRRHAQVKWNRGGDFASQGEVFAEYERTSQSYDAIELLPHYPPIDGIYYRCTTPPLGDGEHLNKFLDRFRPETTIDRDLIQAALMTFFWGGPPGCRPAFVITADEGRGVGKTALAKSIGEIVNGALDVSVGEDIQTFKTRLLSPMARTARAGLCDNVKTMRFSWAEFEALITSPAISGKQMYVGEGRRPNLLTWLITLNGVSLATDMAQRSVIIKLARGKNDGPWLEETTKFILDNRQQIIGDILAALQAKPFPLAEYTRWATWEKDILSRLPEPAEAQRVIIERQGEANSELDEAEIIEQHFADQLMTLGYDPLTTQVRIPVATAARWFGWATGEKTKTTTATKRLNQLASEGHSRRITPDPSRTHGRCFIWTGPAADVIEKPILNDLHVRIGATAGEPLVPDKYQSR